MKDPHVSFLVGAGFSKPADYPLASEINDYFVGFKESDLSIHTDGSAWFNGGNPGPNDHFTRKTERQFVERLIGHYCDRVVTPETFHYESFYDWYKDLRTGRASDPNVEDIAVDLGRSLTNLLLNFDLTFNQLLAQPLSKRPPEVHLCRGLPRSHAKFLDLVEALGQQRTLHFHSLNHDLFFESLSSTDAIQGELADGFTELGSPYYGTLRRVEEAPNGGNWFSYTVRLPFFADEYGARFNLYKLHGSVDYYVFGDTEHATVKNKRGIGPNDLLKEVAEGERLRYESDHGNYYPSFLSGTTYKTLRYDSTPYYTTVFNHFKHNLSTSAVLVTIGYGFADSEINRLIEECFLSRTGSTILVVDIQEPDVPDTMAESTRFFLGGVTNFDYEKLLSGILSASAT
jgi:hypothetical protein